jgi:hypothetical protein
MAHAAGIAQRYVEAMNHGDIEAMMALFAPHPVLRHPTGVYEGVEAVRGFFLDTAFAYSAHLVPIVGRAEADLAWLEVEATSDVTPGRQRVVDVFRLDTEGRIIDLGVYSGNIVSGSGD